MYTSSSTDLTVTKATIAQSTATRLCVVTATAESATARNAESATIALACQCTRSSTVGSTSRSHEKIHSSAKIDTTQPLSAITPRIDAGSHGLSGESRNAEARPATTMKITAWFKKSRLRSPCERGMK